MLSPELSIITLNVVVIMIAYFFIYPRFCGSDFKKISNNDLIASIIPLVISGSIYWDKNQEFNMILFSLNWFWFTIFTYVIVEIPLMIWYTKKHAVFSQILGSDKSNERLDSLLKPLAKDALRLESRADEAALAASCESKFGGVPYAEKDDIWPLCPTCKKELTFINQIRDEYEQQLFVFYYCNACYPWGLGDEEKGQWLVKLYNQPSWNKIVEIIRSSEDEFAPAPCKVATSLVKVLPDWEGIDYVSKEVGDLCCTINDDSPWEEYEEAVKRNGCLNDYATLLGGYPRFVQGNVSPTCPKCDKEMKFYAQIDSENEANIMWGDVGLVYFFRCPEHKSEFHLELQCH